MSIEAKQMLMLDLSSELSSVLTTENKDTVLCILSELLSKYELESIANAEFFDNDSDELLEAYISAKTIEGRSSKTLDRYKYIISKMLKTVNIPIRKISVFHIRTYLSKEKQRGVSDRTLESTREVLSAFFGWLHREGLIPTNPISNLGAIKYPKVTRLPYTQVDIEKLKESCDNDRDRAIISFLLSTGCRVSEVCNLNISDIDFENRECNVLGKGNKERIVYIDDVTVLHLKRYLDSRTDDSEALFVGKGTSRLQPGGIRYMLKRVSKIAEVTNTHPHRFRRTLATSLIDHGMPIQEVAIILGHDKLDTTMEYVYTDNKNVKSSYEKYA